MPCAFDWLELLQFYGTGTCEGMEADPASDVCERAMKQLTAMLLNECSSRVEQLCPVDVAEAGCESGNVGDLIREVADLIHFGDCARAQACAAAVNEGTAFSGESGGGDPAEGSLSPSPRTATAAAASGRAA